MNNDADYDSLKRSHVPFGMNAPALSKQDLQNKRSFMNSSLSPIRERMPDYQRNIKNQTMSKVPFSQDVRHNLYRDPAKD